MKSISELIRTVIERRVLPWIERDGISKLILPEQITPDDCIRVPRCRQYRSTGHREHELAIGLTGRAPYCIKDKAFVFTAGRIVLLPGWISHRPTHPSIRRTKAPNITRSPSILWLKSFPAGVWTQITCGSAEADAMDATRPHLILGRRFSRLIADLLEEIRSRQSGYARIGRCLLIEFLERCLRADIVAAGLPPLHLKRAKAKTKKPPPLVEAALDFIHSNYQAPISLDSIADAADTNINRLGQQFKAATGTTPIQHLLAVRMEAARELLITDLKVHEVAGLVGIEDQRYFSRLFRRSNKGLTPLQYRQRVAKRARRPLPTRKSAK